MLKYIKRILYLAYYFKNQDWHEFTKFMKQIQLETQQSLPRIFWRSIRDSIIYNVSPVESLQFKFYKKSYQEKQKWAGTGYMYEYQRLMNPVNKREILDDKRLFNRMYAKFMHHKSYDLQTLISDPVLGEQLFENPDLVLKQSHGKCGKGTAFVKSANFTPESLVEYMRKNSFDLAETFIEQHPELQKLSPSGVNTVRIITQLNAKNEVEILGCRQRISVNSKVDNLAAGNLVAPINEENGVISGPAVYSDITKKPESIHPVTGVSIVGFQVPFWRDCIELAKEAALEHPQNRSIGWDIVVTPSGPGLIEGNHDWCKLVWQLPVQQGLKDRLEKYV